MLEGARSMKCWGARFNEIVNIQSNFQNKQTIDDEDSGGGGDDEHYWYSKVVKTMFKLHVYH